MSGTEPPSGTKRLVGERRGASSFGLQGLLGGSAALIGAMIVSLYLAPPPSLERSHNASALVLAADGSILRGFLAKDDKLRLPVETGAVDPLYRRMLIAAEDQRFDRHHGVDPVAAARALFQLGLTGHVVSG